MAKRQEFYEPRRLTGGNIEEFRNQLQEELDRIGDVIVQLAEMKYLPQAEQPPKYDTGSMQFFVDGVAVDGYAATVEGLHQFRDLEWFRFLDDEDLDVNGGGVVTDQGDAVLRDSDLKNNGGSILEESTSGVVIQHAFASTGEVVSTTSPMPYDDSIPQITEGGEALSIAFTPKRADSRLRLRSNLIGRGSEVNAVFVNAIFVAGTSDALAVGNFHADPANGIAAGIYTQSVVADIASPGVSQITFSVRFASHTTGTMYLNAAGSGIRRYGGAYASTFEIMEYLP